MVTFTEDNLTEAVLARMQNASSPRAKQVLDAMVRHLHDFVREIEPTEEEWALAIDFLTRTGQMCDDKRQEWIIVSDTLGVTMLVDAINHRDASEATDTTVLGPFFVEGATDYPLGADIARGHKGEAAVVEGIVHDADGKPLAGATVDVWQSDSEGFYDVQIDGGKEEYLRGRFTTDAEGRFWFRSILPTSYPVPTDGPGGELLRAAGRHPFRPAHLHYMIDAPGHRRLVTHVFVEGDEYIESDAVFGVKDSLITSFDPRKSTTTLTGDTVDTPHKYLRFDFRLAPARKQAA